MPIVADVEDLAPAELLLTLALNSKSGKLSAVRGKDKVMLAVQDGAIVYAAAPAVGERIGNLLVSRGLVSEDDLAAALDRQRTDPDAGLVGTILIDMGVLEVDQLTAAVQSQFEAVIRELLAWDSGVMVFEKGDIPDLGAVHINPADVLLSLGQDVEPLLVESLAQRIRPGGGGGDGPSPPAGAAAGAPRASRAEVSALLEEMDSQAVALTAEMTLAILRAAGEVVERAVLFLAYPGFFQGVGGFGAGLERRRLAGRRLQIRRQPGLLLEVAAENRTTYRGPVTADDGNAALLEELGGDPPSEAVAVPLHVHERVVAVLYGDAGPGGGPVASAEPLETTMAELGGLLEAG